MNRPDAQLIALFRAEIANGAAVIAHWLDGDESARASAPAAVLNAVQSIKSAARVLGIADIAHFVDAVEHCVDAYARLRPHAQQGALQAMKRALVYLNDLERSAELLGNLTALSNDAQDMVAGVKAGRGELVVRRRPEDLLDHARRPGGAQRRRPKCVDRESLVSSSVSVESIPGSCTRIVTTMTIGIPSRRRRR